MAEPRCKRCGRILKDPASISRGMGLQCAGATNGETRARQPRIRRGTGQGFALMTHCGDQHQLFASGAAERAEKETRAEKRARIQSVKAQRRASFERRQPFQCGINTLTRETIVYLPRPDGTWVNSEGYHTTHTALEKYLHDYEWI